jgi:hypothetical protein
MVELKRCNQRKHNFATKSTGDHSSAEERRKHRAHPPKAGGHPRLSLVVDDLNKLVRHPKRIVESTPVALLPSLSGDEEHKRVEGPPERLQGEGNQ